MDAQRPTSARYQASSSDADAVTVPLPVPHGALGSSSASSSSHPGTPLASRRRHSNSLTDDGTEDGAKGKERDLENGRRTKRGGIEDDEDDDDDDDDDEEGRGAEALEMDEFLPRTGRGRGRGRRARMEGVDEDPLEKAARDAGDGQAASDDPLQLVKRAVPETDDPTLPALTVRSVIIGSFFAALGAAVAQLFFYKSNSPGFSPYFVILVSMPIGRWMARNLPDRIVRLPLVGPVALNPGPFSIKEHLLIAIIASSGATSAYASDILNIQVLFFNQRMSALSSLTLLLSTQLLGFGFAGLVNDLLVKTPTMIFPWTLVTTSLFHTLHGTESVDMRRRLRFFFLAFMAVFAYQFLPALMAPTLSSVAVLCLFGNGGEWVKILGSGYKGLGFLNVSLDWTAIGSSGPLFQPWWAALNYYVGFAGMMWIVMPLLYFVVNFWDAQSFPSVLGSALFTASKPREKFDVSSVLRSDNMLDWDKWQEKGPIRLTPYFAISYGISFAVLTSMLSHVFLWHWKDVKRALTSSGAVHEDYHNRAMRNYEEVPKSWYCITLFFSIGAAVLLVAFAPLQLPVWALLTALMIALAFLVPAGIILAVSDTGVSPTLQFGKGHELLPLTNTCSLPSTASLTRSGRPKRDYRVRCRVYAAWQTNRQRHVQVLRVSSAKVDVLDPHRPSTDACAVLCTLAVLLLG